MLKVATLKAAIAHLDRAPRGAIVTAPLVNHNQDDVIPGYLTRDGGGMLWMPHPQATNVEGHGTWERLPPLKPHTVGHNLRVQHPDNSWSRYRYPSPPPMFDQADDAHERDGSSVSSMQMGDWHAVGARVQNGQQRLSEGEAPYLPPGTQARPVRHQSRQGSRSVPSIESRQSHSEDVIEVRRARRREFEDYVRANYGYRGGINYTLAAHELSAPGLTVTEADLRRALVKGTMFDSYDNAAQRMHSLRVARALDEVLPLAFATDF